MIGIGIPRSQSRMGIGTSSLTEMNADGERKLQRLCGPVPWGAARQSARPVDTWKAALISRSAP